MYDRERFARNLGRLLTGMRSLQNSSARLAKSFSQLEEHEGEPFALLDPPLAHLEHTEEGKNERATVGFHHGQCGSGGAKPKLAPGSHYPSTDHDRENGQIDRSLPEGIYGAFILIWLNKSSNCDRHTLWWAVKTGLPAALLASHYAQLTFSYYLYNFVHQPHNSLNSDMLSDYCHEGSTVLKMLGVVAFLSLCFGDLQVTYEMHLWLCMFKTAKKHEKLQVHQWVDSSNKNAKGTKIYLPLTGITCFARFLFYTLVLVPKVVVALCVAVAGSGLVLRSESDYDLVLNAVAAGFVLELDEVVHRVFLT